MKTIFNVAREEYHDFKWCATFILAPDPTLKKVLVDVWLKVANNQAHLCFSYSKRRPKATYKKWTLTEKCLQYKLRITTAKICQIIFFSTSIAIFCPFFILISRYAIWKKTILYLNQESNEKFKNPPEVLKSISTKKSQCTDIHEIVDNIGTW